jgi:glycosyltransferase involved in cell wall biosynthesis
MTRLSAVIITLNEAKNLPRVLASLAWADEILVLDSYSTDNTAAIAESLGCRVIFNKFNGYGEQKRLAVNAASNNWVLVVDADEEVSPELAAEIKNLLKAPTLPMSGYLVPRHFIFMGKLIRFGGEHGKAFIRLFNKEAGNFNLAEVHEDVALKGPIGALKGHLLHYSYSDLHSYFLKFNEYTTRGAREMFRNNKKVGWLYIAVRFPASFFQLYFMKGLLLDGYPGFIWALFSAFYPVAKYAKLKEMQRLGSMY